MIRIPYDSVQPPSGWQSKADTAAETLAATAKEIRREIIDHYSPLWRELKPLLADVSHNKCWYCESTVDRSDNAVDHYRPKLSVKGESSHDGYWWLAFDWSNFRYACTYCNSLRRSNRGNTVGGKRDEFPLWDDSKRAAGPMSDISLEQPLLLDPVVHGDPEHLWFDITGRPTASPMYENRDSLPYARVQSTIRLLHLDEESICERRKVRRHEVTRIIEAAQFAISLYEDGDPRAAEVVKHNYEQLGAMASPTHELSSTVRCAIAELQGEFPFARSIRW